MARGGGRQGDTFLQILFEEILPVDPILLIDEHGSSDEILGVLGDEGVRWELYFLLDSFLELEDRHAA